MYKIIEDAIKKRIEKGSLKNGDMIESENELKEVYSVSRMTVRVALNNLVNEGYLYRHKGKGTFVNHTKIEKGLDGITGFTEDLNSNNIKVTNKIISMELIDATEVVCERLMLDEGSQVYKIERLRCGDSIPISYEIVYLPESIFGEIDKSVFEGSFYKYVENEIGKITYCTQKIEARQCGPKYHSFLEISSEMPILYVSVVSNLENGRPFEYTRSFYRGDQYRLVRRTLR